MPRTVLEKIRAGEIESINNVPQVKDNHGNYQGASPIMAGWAFTWKRISETLEESVDVSPLNVIARKLYLDKLISEVELVAAESCLNQLLALFRKTPRQIVSDLARAAQMELAEKTHIDV